MTGLFWALLMYAALIGLYSLIYAVRYTRPNSAPFASILHYSVHVNIGRRFFRLEFSLLGLINGFCSPFSMLFNLYHFVKAARATPKWYQVDARSRVNETLMQNLSSSYASGWVCLATVASIGAATLYVPAARLPLIIWTAVLWLCLLLLLMTTLLPDKSVSLWIKAVPKHRLGHILSTTAQFAIALPLSSALLSVGLLGKQPTPDILISKFFDIYTLNGVLWEGLKAAVSGFLKQPSNVISISTG